MPKEIFDGKGYLLRSHQHKLWGGERDRYDSLRASNDNADLGFEKYDYRFQWNKPSSIIDIYLPLSASTEL